LFKELIKEIAKVNPLQGQFVEDNIVNLTIEEKQSFASYLHYCQKQDISTAFLASSYDLIVRDTFKEQVYFQRHKQYRYATYAEVAQSVYHSPEYMSKYMYGLALSAYLWPNHREMHNFFLSQLPKNNDGNYLEVGPGHGFYFMQSMRHSNFKHFTGVDISATSVEMTKSILSSNHFGQFSHFDINQCDFLNWETSKKFDFIVMAEVLEHVENPQLFLKKIKDSLTTTGKAFITTCINAPAIDHIYLYRSIDELIAQVNDENLVVIEQLIVPYLHLSLEETMAKQLPVNIAMSLSLK